MGFDEIKDAVASEKFELELLLSAYLSRMCHSLQSHYVIDEGSYWFFSLKDGREESRGRRTFSNSYDVS